MVHFVENWGEGWDKIIDNFKNSEYDFKMPEIIDTENTVIVKIFSPEEIYISDNADKNTRQQSILIAIKNNGSIIL